MALIEFEMKMIFHRNNIEIRTIDDGFNGKNSSSHFGNLPHGGMENSAIDFVGSSSYCWYIFRLIVISEEMIGGIFYHRN